MRTHEPVDHDVAHDELVEAWVNGNRKWVIGQLSQRHPAITALFLVEGTISGQLDRGDCNSITNQLMDDFTEIRDELGIEKTHRPVS